MLPAELRERPAGCAAELLPLLLPLAIHASLTAFAPGGSPGLPLPAEPFPVEGGVEARGDAEACASDLCLPLPLGAGDLVVASGADCSALAATCNGPDAFGVGRFGFGGGFGFATGGALSGGFATEAEADCSALAAAFT